ncbi:GFA family protein [Anaerobaca lacustris]|uniref:GFA family protein n=1 Tax=Anaerobaca lacustris TaxID=3044600 RepID=A0AAW6TY99_9BACT|nr:GFA family protein [Sedimentisphaerales bacterium M17dextr]
METILRGGCLCGAVRYECTGDPGDASYCHCDDCKRATGGPYTVGVLVRAADLRILSGQVKGHATVADSGRKITRQFCPECGSPLFTRAEKCPDLVFLKAGSLDEPQRVKPSCQTWTKRAVPWAYIDTSLRAFPESRPS